MSSKIFLRWSNGRHYEGGTGAYATDGPKPMEHVKERSTAISALKTEAKPSGKIDFFSPDLATIGSR